ncbi:MAG: ankyrin repeat domain-containing protein [Stellaceae bacterium]
MKMRRTMILGLAAIAVAVGAAGAHAQLNLNPFAAYYDNVARAAAQNDAEAVRKLVGGGAGNPNQVDDQSRTAMHIAAINGNLQIIAILIKADAKLNPVDQLGDTPLHLAADRNQTEAAKLLLDSGAEVDPQNKDGMTPLMIAANRGNLELVRALLAKGANPGKTDYTGRDALGWAQDSHRPAVVEAITRAQAAKGS